MSTRQLSKNQHGFTLVELMIAISVLSMTLLIVTAGIVSIGNSYYRGITQANTQQAARTILDTLQQNLQFGNYGSISSPPVTAVSGSTTVNAICVGEQRYSYVLGYKKTGPTALWRDDMTTTTCGPLDVTSAVSTPPVMGAASPSAIGSGRDMLGNNMRVTNFLVNTAAGQSNVYNVQVTVMYGDDDLIDKGPVGTPMKDWKCLPSQGIIGGSFCAKSELSTIIGKRLN